MHTTNPKHQQPDHITWRDVCIVIPATLSAPGRADSLRDLLVRIMQECHGAIVRVLPQWRTSVDPQDILTTLSDGLRGIKRPYVLWIEDDVILCRDFGAKALDAIRQHVDARKVLSLFSTLDRPAGVSEIPVIMGCQAVAMPAWIAREWSGAIADLRTAPIHGSYAAIDHALTRLCRDRGVEISAIFPNLVQHGHLPSAWGHTAVMRSPTFID